MLSPILPTSLSKGQGNSSPRPFFFWKRADFRAADGQPWYDQFPYDFFAQLLNSKRIEDSYQWTFQLEEKQQISREKLIENAQKLKKQL